MPDDLLRFVIGPSPYSGWWLWLAVLLILLVIGWYTVVFVWTLSAERLRRMPVIRSWHATLLRRRFARTIDDIAERHRRGDLPAPHAAAQISRALRSFLHQATGTPAQYMHVEAISSGELAPAAPVLEALNDAQFNNSSPVDIDQTGSAAGELVRTWP
ncbi:hypothetical protein AAHH97_06635 [Mycolicibacterium elephantis]|uniref:hypothetical protein n=1 Tax=Mycolicibacterium elephantis TaxID=81858 RepID=UPI003A88A48F